MKITPSINCPDWECLDRKLRVANEKLRAAEWLHLDVADGRFTMNRNWGDPAAWQRHNRYFKTELHLMAEEPEISAEAWLKTGIGRLVVHLESMPEGERTARFLRTLCAAHDCELGLALNAETPLARLRPHLKETSFFQVFAQAYPGPPHQNFLPAVLPKIRGLRALAPHATIEVDGGMRPDTIRLVKDAGADAAVSGSYIFNSPDPAQAYAELSAI